jgi:hypothetical protein
MGSIIKASFTGLPRFTLQKIAVIHLKLSLFSVIPLHKSDGNREREREKGRQGDKKIHHSIIILY